MLNLWVNLAISAAVLVGLGILLVMLRRQAPSGRTGALTPRGDASGDGGCAVGTCVSEREQRLGRRLAQMVGCSYAQALPFIQREVDFAPHQSDDTLLRRAAYHYRRELPEKDCPPFPERTRG